MDIGFVGGLGIGRSSAASGEVCQNLYPTIDEAGRLALYGTPGMKLLVDLGYARQVRGAIVFNGFLFVVCGERFYKVDTSWTATRVYSDLDTRFGIVSIKRNLTQIAISDGLRYYIYDSASGTLSKATDPDIPVLSDIEEQDSYIIMSEKDTDNFFISGINDAGNVDALDFSAADAKPDKTKRIISDHRELFFLGEDSTQVFYDSGNADFPFEIVPGGFIEHGISAPRSACRFDNSLIWLDQNYQVVRLNGYSPEIKSTEAVEYHFSRFSTKNDAIGYSYVQEHHTFYVLTFPTEGKTFVYDAYTDQWHTRASGITNDRHRGNCCVFFNGKNVVGDYKNGKLYEYDLSTYTDDGEPIIAKRSKELPFNGKKVRHRSFELFTDPGVGLESGDDPLAVLKYSDDFGKTWSNERTKSLGKIGEHNKRVIWWNLGASRQRIYEVSISDPVRRVIRGASVNG